jgi:hypothetical protein
VTLGTVPDVVTNVRNRGLLRDEQRPATVLLDADETSTVFKTGARGGFVPTINTMRPEIFYLEKEGRIKNEEIGEKLNATRLLICKALAEDATLVALLGSNGGITYNGCVTDLKSGASLAGELKLDFSFRYVFDPTIA